MNALELRTKIYNALTSRKNPVPDVVDASLTSPAPGQPVSIIVETTDPFGQPRRYRVMVEEI
ncbi:hypothetical protein [Streptomyces sp. NPDC101393]|uniref:hypothetical protein n=1 Tax=Streptomyces sp. NPDC101393 TaxID=3366141 RepID=UPI0038290E2B